MKIWFTNYDKQLKSGYRRVEVLNQQAIIEASRLNLGLHCDSIPSYLCTGDVSVYNRAAEKGIAISC